MAIAPPPTALFMTQAWTAAANIIVQVNANQRNIKKVFSER